MKTGNILGMILGFFGLVTLLNLYDINYKLNQVGLQVEGLTILTWLGIAVTQFILGAIMIFSEEHTEDDDLDRVMEEWQEESQPKQDKSQPRQKQPFKFTQKQKYLIAIIIATILLILGAYVWLVKIFQIF